MTPPSASTIAIICRAGVPGGTVRNAGALPSGVTDTPSFRERTASRARGFPDIALTSQSMVESSTAAGCLEPAKRRSLARLGAAADVRLAAAREVRPRGKLLENYTSLKAAFFCFD